MAGAVKMMMMMVVVISFYVEKKFIISVIIIFHSLPDFYALSLTFHSESVITAQLSQLRSFHFHS